MPERLPSDYSVLFRRLVVLDSQRRLPGTQEQSEEPLSRDDTARLLGFASVLALSDAPDERGAAYEIATRVAADPRVTADLVHAADVILARLGNFPGRTLLHERQPTAFKNEVLGTAYLDLEVMAREVENTIVDASGNSQLVTDFQREVLDIFQQFGSASISAPTSAGKSFLFSIEVIRRLRSTPGACVIYVVPTRALIRQVSLGLREDLRKAGVAVPVRAVPTPIDRSQAEAGIVFVLTQERLLSLLQAPADQVWVTTLIVDEAQGISDGSRGILLHTAIEEVNRRFPAADVLFASPLSRNPEYLLDTFRKGRGKPYTEQHSPVAQNLILASRVHGRPSYLQFTQLWANEKIDLGTRDVGFAFGTEGVLDRRAKFALAVSRPGSACIVYANGARDAEVLAEEIAEASPQLDSPSARLTEFVSFLAEYIHPEYGLIHALQRGVGFHYSNMPGSVRAGVEDLCKTGELRFICCTSTLLQGVNLPARDIVVENPKRGMGKPMLRNDFVNLAGRAGRLLREFHGNVWCLRPELWESPSYTGPLLQPIESALAVTLKDGGTLIRRLLRQDDTLADSERETATAALGRVYSDYIIRGRSLLDSDFRTPENEASLRETMVSVAEIARSLPAEVFFENHGLLPTRLEELAVEFRNAEDPTKLVPIAPFVPGTNSRLFEIFERVQRILENDDTNRYKYYWYLAKEWLHQNHLSQIIRERLAYEPTANIRNTIYSVIEDIEKVIRFRMVRNLRAYNSVLAAVLREKGHGDLADSLVPMHLFLECGATDTVALSLISLGLSRTSALILKAHIFFPRESTPEECLTKLEASNIAGLSIPPFCRREVESLLRGEH